MFLFYKWLHIIAVISWMAGILYIFRLFIYHFERGQTNKEIHELMSLMEHRLYRYITMPALTVAWIAAIGMLYLVPSYLHEGWFHSKLFFALVLTGVTHYSGKVHKRFKESNFDGFTSKKLRWINEIPTVLMLIIVAMVIFRPF